MVEEHWTLEQFCFSKEMQNIYTKFFWGFPISRFDFVGITENYASDLNDFAAKILGREPPMSAANVNLQKATDRYVEDEHLRSRLEQFHQKDMDVYRDVLRVSDSRR